MSHRVVGNLVRNKAGRPQNYFRIEGPAAGDAGKNIKQTGRFFITGQKFRNTQTDPAPPEEVDAG